MPLTVEEIRPGLVVFLDQAMFLERWDVLQTLPTRSVKVRPHVCLSVDGERCAWTPLTSRWRRERLPILASWRLGGDRAWRGARSYLHDGASVVVGPRAAFVHASHKDVAPAEERPALTPEGCAQILVAIERARGRRQVGPSLVLTADRITGLPQGDGPVRASRPR